MSVLAVKAIVQIFGKLKKKKKKKKHIQIHRDANFQILI